MHLCSKAHLWPLLIFCSCGLLYAWSYFTSQSPCYLCNPFQVILTTLLKVYVRAGLFEKSRELLGELRDLGYAKDEVTSYIYLCFAKIQKICMLLFLDIIKRMYVYVFVCTFDNHGHYWYKLRTIYAETVY